MTATEQENLAELLTLIDQLFGQRSDDSCCHYRLGRTRTRWQLEIAYDAFC